jgi:hypothetical protein
MYIHPWISPIQIHMYSMRRYGVYNGKIDLVVKVGGGEGGVRRVLE